MEPDEQAPTQFVALPSLKKEKIEKLHRSKNKKFEVTMDRIKQKFRSMMETRTAAYDRDNDQFWADWKSGFEIASMWDKENVDSRTRYEQRVKERSDNLYSKAWTRYYNKSKK